jgi:DsbC/DsbD-like thiol-disulfide interchange protein
MIKNILFLTFLSFIVSYTAVGQLTSQQPNPVSVNVSLDQTADGNYNLLINAKIKKGFHIWALDPGGDGSLIATHVTINSPAPIVWKEDEWKESKEPVVRTLDFIEGAIRWHEEEVLFSRKIFLSKGDVLSGTVTYQTCNEEMCLPPVSEDFSLKVE